MSSPFMAPYDGFSDQAGGSSPGRTAEESSYNQAAQDHDIRLMKLKVLYTFDDQNKTNCLARWPQVLRVRTAYLDESTLIGIIDLNTCIKAIVSASPELVAKLGQDYTVYAYDYSEYETPLVGQGMLSWVLANSSPPAPAQESRISVTGRVCKNILGLFSGGPQETLEVKLRLVPVPTCLQSEFIDSMRKYRELSKVMPEGFDAQAWSNFIQANPGILSLPDQNRCQSPNGGGGTPRDVGIEHVQRLFHEGYTHQHRAGNGQSQRRDSHSNVSMSQDSFRAGSPAVSTQPTTTDYTYRQNPGELTSRAPSRAGNVQTRSRGSSVDLGYASNEDRSGEHARKRAKVTKGEWPSKGSFGQQVDSLRVVASTAASVRVFQPTAIRPLASTGGSLEEPPRAPTPIPKLGNRGLRPAVAQGRSGLGRESLSTNNTEYTSPYGQSDDSAKLPNLAMTSPEDRRRFSTSKSPAGVDIASSPPVFRNTSPAPSSPMLPALSGDIDSGFMSGPIDDLFEDNEDRPLDELDLEIAAQYDRRDATASVQPIQGETVNVAATKEIHTEEQGVNGFSLQSTKEAKDSHLPRMLNRTASTGSSALPPVAASDPVRPTSGMLQRSQTWSGHGMLHPASDAPMGSEGIVAPKRPSSRSGSGVKRKKQIQSKLADTIAAGEMPPFCENCGAIETPTWRKAWTKLHSGSPERVEISRSEGGIVAVQTIETDAEGIITLFKIFKKSLLKTDVDFEEILLCNPCGLWLHNRQCLRPRELWKESRDRFDDNGKKEGSRKKAKTERTAKRSTKKPSDGTAISSDGSSPVDGAQSDSRSHKANDEQLPQLRRQKEKDVQLIDIRQTKSDGLNETGALIALQRAIQSSPARVIGTKHVPIELDGDQISKPTRRILFPSPKPSTDPTALAVKEANTSPPSQGGSPRKSRRLHNNITCNQSDKENFPPPPNDGIDDGLDDLFDEPAQPASCPSTPPSSSKHNPFRTPTRTPMASKQSLGTGDFFSSAAKAFLHASTTPKRTPSKSSGQQSPMEEMTPFTAHLHQVLSEADHHQDSPSKFLDFSPMRAMDGSTSANHFIDGDQGFGFGEFDEGMPSSPPAWFGVYEDVGEGSKTGNGVWDLGLGDSPNQGLEIS